VYKTSGTVCSWGDFEARVIAAIPVHQQAIESGRDRFHGGIEIKHPDEGAIAGKNPDGDRTFLFGKGYGERLDISVT
jgi:hypothetical protein